MKYTKYLIEKNVIDVDSIQTESFLFKMPMVGIGIFISVIGIVIIGSIIPITCAVDKYRENKSYRIHQKRKSKKLY